MGRLTRWSETALSDLNRCAVYVATRARNRDQGDRFYDAAGRVTTDIARAPCRGREKHRLSTGEVVWHVPIARFRSLRIVYQRVDDQVHILRVLPSAMVPRK